MYDIPFNRPCLLGKELTYVAEAARSGKISDDGPFSTRVCTLLQEKLSSRHALLTPSCTAGLELMGTTYGWRPGDEIILPSFTHVSLANAVCLRGAFPRFVDIRPDTLNLDESRIEEVVSPRTRAILFIHYGGVSCELTSIRAIADRYGLAIIEDASLGIGASYRDRPLGTFGDVGCLSFHGTKNFTSGIGGALLFQDEVLFQRVQVIRACGTNRTAFREGLVDQYSWITPGSNAVLCELNAAYLLGQLERFDEVIRARRQSFDFYQRELEDLERRGFLRRPVIPDGCQPSGHCFHLLLRSRKERDTFIAQLAKQGIEVVFHYTPLHSSSMGHTLGYRPEDCPVTEDLAYRLVRLPFYSSITQADLSRVVAAIEHFFKADC